MQKDYDLLILGEHWDPFGVLGPHEKDGGVVIRALIPNSAAMWVLRGKKEIPMGRVHDGGIFEVFIKGEEPALDYMLKVKDANGSEWTYHDPYRYGRILSDFDLHLIAEGTHYRKYEKLGAHVIDAYGIRGVHFALWAPNARRVSVVGNFNSWNGLRNPMRSLGSTGVWEIFIPALAEGELYKFEIKSNVGGLITLKTDPYAMFTEIRPNTASIVWDIDTYEWNDGDWMKERPKKDWLNSAVSVYEVHLGSWMRTYDGGFMNYRDIAHRLVQYVKETGFTHIELLPVTEHPLDASWGYQTIGYYSVTSRFGTPEDFMYFVDHCHQNGIGVIVDWVPAHFPKDAHGLAFFDGTFLYEHEEPKRREQLDWGTHVFNYGRKEVSNYLLTSALFWLEKYHIDGLRVDAVASMLYLDYSRPDGGWVPNMFGGNEDLDAIVFIKRFNELCHQYHPGVLTIAEESTAWPMVSRPTYLGGLGFSMKWNMGWMHDMLEYIKNNPIFRKFHHNNLTFAMLYAFNENFVLVLSHDEVVHGKRSLLDKMPGDMWQKFANLRLLLGYMFAQPGKKLIFMGGEFGQWTEWDFNRQLDWDLLNYEQHSKLKQFVSDLNRLYREEPALHEVDSSYEGFRWVDFHDWEGSVIAFSRVGRDPNDYIIFAFNFTPVVRENYKLGAPEKTTYIELLNSDSHIYWGSDKGNMGAVVPIDEPCHEWPYTLNVTLPPLGMIALKPKRD